MTHERWVVGAEYDAESFTKLGAVLRELGYTLGAGSFGLGGSQEVRTWTFRGPKGTLVVETETYIGLTISGYVSLVSEVRQLFNSTATHQR